MSPVGNMYNKSEVAPQQFLTSSLLTHFCVMVQNISEVARTVDSSHRKNYQSPLGTDVEGITIRDATYAGILQKYVL